MTKPVEDQNMVIKGGSWFSHAPCVTAYRTTTKAPEFRLPRIGFRCVQRTKHPIS